MKKFNIIEDKFCTGCIACMNICPKNAINAYEDKNGFKCPEMIKISV